MEVLKYNKPLDTCTAIFGKHQEAHTLFLPHIDMTYNGIILLSLFLF
jgi:hypothetical protein